MKIKYMKKCLLLMGFCIAQANVTEINLSGQKEGNEKIGSWNIKEIVSEALLNNDNYKRPFRLILSDNYINDYSIEELAKLFTAERGRFGRNLVQLDLSNNRLTNECFRSFLPIFAEAENLEWINLAINCINTDDFFKFFNIISRYVEYDEEKEQELAEKIVWLPSNYHVKRFFSEGSPFYRAHRKCYPDCSLDN